MDRNTDVLNFTRDNVKYLEHESNYTIPTKLGFMDDMYSVFSTVPTSDTRIKKVKRMITPWEIKRLIVLDKKTEESINRYRRSIEDILNKKSKKKIMIVGPCSIHNVKQAIEYAKFVKGMRDKYSSRLEIVMRVFVTKSRTNIGWKGFVYDPYLDGSNNMEIGLKLSRKMMMTIVKMGVPCAMEHIDTIIPQYFDDLLSWAVIGSNATNSQIHRELASGISTPIGYKNKLKGSISSSINAIITSQNPHHFIGCDINGDICSFETTGNPNCHIILRGCELSRYNYREDLDKIVKHINSNNIKNGILIDCYSIDFKDNSQTVIANNIAKELKNKSIVGIMLKSNLVAGKQYMYKKDNIKYNISVTDECINLEETEKILDLYYKSVK